MLVRVSILIPKLYLFYTLLSKRYHLFLIKPFFSFNKKPNFLNVVLRQTAVQEPCLNKIQSKIGKLLVKSDQRSKEDYNSDQVFVASFQYLTVFDTWCY